MASLALRRDLSLEVPKLLVGTVQPYQTLAGPALTTSFLHQPELLPFQATPFFHAAVAPLYFHTLLHTLAEFAETPRTLHQRHVALRQAPKPDFWTAVGTLNCFYYSAHSAAWGGGLRQGETGPQRGGLTAQHPAMGAVELVRPSHRQASDVKLTLFNGDHQPLASMLMTGPREEAGLPTLSAALENEEGGAAVPPASPEHRRTPLPFLKPPATSSEWAASSLPVDEFGVDAVSTIVVGGTPVRGGLYGDVMVMGADETEGYAHRAFYKTDDGRAATAVSPTTSAERESGEAPAVTAQTAMPPWVLYDCVLRFFYCLHGGGYLSKDPLITPVTGWRLASHHVVQVADAVLGLPMEVVCAAPRVYPHYRLPPWRAKLGLPMLSGGAVPCVALRCEVRQSGQVISTGVYFFCRLV